MSKYNFLGPPVLTPAVNCIPNETITSKRKIIRNNDESSIYHNVNHKHREKTENYASIFSSLLKNFKLREPNLNSLKIIDVYGVDNGEIPDCIQMLLDGASTASNFNTPITCKPEWLDIPKFEMGQKFAQKYFFGLLYSEVLALILNLAWNAVLDPLIYTGKSDTSYTAFKRYLSTLHRLRSWYTDNVWETNTKGRKNILIVRAMHSAIQKCMETVPKQEFDESITELRQRAMATLVHKVKGDADRSCRPCPFSVSNVKPTLTQAEMVVTQFAFVGLMILYPERFGAASASEAELEGFIVLWRGIGWLMGIQDRYNICSGDLATVRERCEAIIEYWYKPALRHASVEWEHMTRCISNGIRLIIPSPPYEASLLYVCDVVKADMPQLWTELNLPHRMWYVFTHLTFKFLVYLPGFIRFANWYLHRKINKLYNPSKNFERRLKRKLRTRSKIQKYYWFPILFTCFRLFCYGGVSLVYVEEPS